MFINAGARKLLLQGERQKFLDEEWPRIYENIQRLGLTPKELLNGRTGKSSDTEAKKAKASEPNQSAGSGTPSGNSSEEER